MQLVRIFGQKSNSMSSQNGLNLGLNICQRIVSEYGGQMTVRSKNNQGSDFGFSFQATELDEEAQEPSTS